jgi:hypothetical protein
VTDGEDIMVELWGDIGFLVFTFSALVFTTLYLSMSRFYKSFVGSIIGVFSISVVILCGYLSLRVWDVTIPGVEWVRLVIFWVLGVTMLTSIFGFIQVQFLRRLRPDKQQFSARSIDTDKGV